VGLEKADDAGVYKLTDDLALIQTLDFFTPIVDDPYMFGQIAAANALSDVYAMGGRPLTAMNIVCFPHKTMSILTLREILIGGLDKLREAGVVLVGGHSVKDPELKYGLSVTGVIHPQKVMAKSKAKPGDKLILTKPLGTGIINTAVKAGLVGEETITKVTRCMATLNKEPSELALASDAHAFSDVTGFGLLGHAFEMAERSEVGIEIRSTSVPIFAGVKKFARREDLIPPGTRSNREYIMSKVELVREIPEHILWLLFDAQTSGGLLISLPERNSDILLQKLHEKGIEDTAIIGEVKEEPKGRIIIS
jgi:selenide,water dikinase